MMTKDTSPGNTPPNTQSRHFSILIFQLGGQEYGLPITDVVQIIEMVILTHLPEAPVAVQGVINLRGKKRATPLSPPN
ncbi:MAG: chemotaxis protein CheW [Chloroflexi bacterium]|nr:chemotaxis protein CheW [Chloroflexota bacterium]